jgi:beta-lactamase regulating signal transducer with metallopeptidase domain
MAGDLLSLLIRANLALGVAVLLVLALRRPVRSLFGARAAYALWLIAPLAVLAVLLPARTITVRAPAETPAAQTSAVAMVAQSPAVLPKVNLANTSLITAARSLPVADLVFWTWAVVALLAVALQVERQRRFVRSLGRLRGDDGLFHAERPGVGPAVIGALAPKLVLPADFAVRFTLEEQALILAHERSHLAAGDAQINALATALQCLFWFNPLVHLGARRLRIDQEIACDAAVLNRFPVSRRAYGEAMLKTQLAPFAPPLGCHWPASANKQLKERFVMLKEHRQGRARRLAGGAAVAVLGLSAGAAVWAAQPARVVHTEAGVSRHDAALHRASPLYKAVEDGDLARAKALIADGAQVDFKARGDGTPLIEASRAGRADIVALLLAHGADPNLSVRGDGSPLTQAVHAGRTEVVDLLLAKGADVGLAVPGDGDPLIAAAGSGRLDLVTTLVEHGASVESFVPGDETPLINAAQSGDLATVRYLVDKGADVNRAVPANRGQTRSPLGEAFRLGHKAVVDYLKSKGARA